jgi:tRNA nucleotidyltransferase/poly(A) polymerase
LERVLRQCIKGSIMLGERETAVGVARLLQERGFVALFVGGCVRDKVLGLAPGDFDVATNAPLDLVEALITPLAEGAPRRGSNYPVAKFKINGYAIDVTSMKNGSLVDDTNRRDFTMNAMFEDPISGELFDLLHGLDDIRRGIVRGVGDVVAHMKDDRRRMLRAPRFASKFGFYIDVDVWTASRTCAHLVSDIDPEWMVKECRAMGQGPYRRLAWEFLVWTGVIDYIPQGVVDECFGRSHGSTRCGGAHNHGAFGNAVAAIRDRVLVPVIGEPRVFANGVAS